MVRRPRARLLVAEGDAAAGEVVGAELDAHLVADEDADVELAHLPRGVRQHLLPRLQLHLEHGVGKRLDDGGVHLDRLFLDLDGRVGSGTSVATACRTAATRASGPGWTTSQASRCSSSDCKSC